MTDPTMNEAENRNATMSAAIPHVRVEAVVRCSECRDGFRQSNGQMWCSLHACPTGSICTCANAVAKAPNPGADDRAEGRPL